MDLETQLKNCKKELLILQEEYIKLQKSCNRKKRIIDNNIAIVTAAGQGLGESIAKTFAKEGAIVILVDINQQELLRVREDIIESGGKAALVTADLTKSDQVNDMVNGVIKDYKKVDILINGAGGFQSFSPINEITEIFFFLANLTTSNIFEDLPEELNIKSVSFLLPKFSN